MQQPLGQRLLRGLGVSCILRMQISITTGFKLEDLLLLMMVLQLNDLDGFDILIFKIGNHGIL